MGAVQEVCKWRDDEQISESTCRRRYRGTVVGMVRFGFIRTAAPPPSSSCWPTDISPEKWPSLSDRIGETRPPQWPTMI